MLTPVDDETLPEAFVERIVDLCRCVVCHGIVTEACLCVNGHLTCQDCLISQAITCASPQLHTGCAICRDGSSWGQALFAKALLETVEEGAGKPFLSCDNENCGAALAVEDLETHRRTCPYRRLACPHPRCIEEVCAKDLLRHLVIHDDVIVATRGVPITFFIVNFYIARTIVVRDDDEGSEPAAVFRIDMGGAFGRSGPFEIQQAMLRLCCLTPRATGPWMATVENRTVNVACQTFETTHMKVPEAVSLSRCQVLARCTVAGHCDAMIEEPCIHTGEDVAAWWNGSRMQDLRRGLHCRSEQQAFPRGNLHRETSAMLLTLTLC